MLCAGGGDDLVTFTAASVARARLSRWRWELSEDVKAFLDNRASDAISRSSFNKDDEKCVEWRSCD